MKENLTKKYGPLTALSMVVGIVIGIGVYFRTGDLIAITQGNTLIALCAWIFGGCITIFAGLTIAELASSYSTTGGDITYMQYAAGDLPAFVLGWGHIIIARPAISAVFAWVGAEFATLAIGIDTEMWQLPLALVFLIFTYGINIFAPKFGGKYQVVMTIIKLVPIGLLIVLGLTYDNGYISQLADPITLASDTNPILLFFAALTPIVFTFDGWIAAATASEEIEQPHKNLPKALIGGLSLVVFLYILLYLAFVNVFPASELRDQVPFGVAEVLLGTLGAKFLMVGITISALGALNGFSMATIRTPYSLAIRNMMIFSEKFSEVNPKTDTNIPSGILMFIITSFYILCNYFFGASGDFSVIGSAFSMIFLIVIYVGMIKLRYQGKLNSEGYKTPFFPLIPVLAIVCTSALAIGLFFINADTTRNVIISIIIYSCGIPLYYIEKKRTKSKLV